MLDRSVIVDVIGEIGEVFPLRADATIGRLAATWARVLHDVPAEALRRAARAYLSSDARWFPTPGKLRSLALSGCDPTGPDDTTPVGRYQVWLLAGGIGRDEPCPVCDSVLAADPRSGRMTVRHDHQRHYEAGVPYEGERTGPTYGQQMQPSADG